ncbi:hypothetical protein EOE18_05940 [Novosphingobium umbonatum]|uniref:Uncharacterized protein n=1 Tax=Novosphingobium umbonatum TaxID=1908524 RepID=A0A3S2UT67_9SPHN|nr:hypothetical protein [Novosphingobium umbonatum]RVU06360.1 hypothetical protein EOE18_05940 [Novosphingobium umbonatum]
MMRGMRALLLAVTLGAAHAAKAQPQPQVEVEFLATLSSEGSHVGDMFPIRLAKAASLDNGETLPAGLMGLGEVVEAKPAGGGGAPGVLVLALRYLDHHGRKIALRSLQQNMVGRDRVNEMRRHGSLSLATALPMSMLGMATRGGNIVVAKGSYALADVAGELGAAEAASASSADWPEKAALDVPPPPKGMGQVVFYRPDSLSWKMIGCTIREEERKLSSLGSGRWFAYVASAGVHAFRVTSETSDSLRLNVEAGETQYVSCRLRASVLIARPVIRPEAASGFHAALSGLKLVDDDDMGAVSPQGYALRQADIRQALAQRSGPPQHGQVARPAQDGSVIDKMDDSSRRLLEQGLRKMARGAAAR